MSMQLLAESGLADMGPWGITLGLVAALGFVGYRSGLFLALVAALAIMTAFCGALGLAPDLAKYFETLRWLPAIVLPLAYFLIFVGVLLAATAGVTSCITEDDAWLSPKIDRIGGGIAGAFAGWLLAGALLVGWSMIELPVGVRPPVPSQTRDAGTWVLEMFTRLCEPKTVKRERLLEGDAVRDKGAAGGDVVQATEPFDDVDLDGRRGDGEPFIDKDRSSSFTIRQAVTDHATDVNGVRDVGLLDRYWLSAWRRMKVLHPPQISSVALDVTSQVAAKGETVYTATVKDADPNHESQLKYALKAGREDDAALLTVEPATGIVKFRDDVEIDGTLRKVHFTLIVEDPAGLMDEKDLEIKLRAPQKQAEPSRE
ncbi:MAG: cadherin repeat domain-containing protein [Planctomycetes bacterium]|nr:cadherin repeat domain-containing protein [Planctomycetota bacterium]